MGEHDYTREGLSTVNYTVVSEELKYIYSSGTDLASSGVAGSRKTRNKKKAEAKARDSQPKRFSYTHIKVDF